MKFTIKRLMLWVVMVASLCYMALGPRPENVLVNLAVAATVTVTVFLTAKQHPLTAFVVGFVCLNLVPLLRDNDNALSYSIWGTYGACFLGAFVGWDARSREKAVSAENESAE
jgi:hypothetical protein